MPKVLTTFVIDHDLKERVRMYSRMSGFTMSEVIRRAVQEYMKRQETLVPVKQSVNR